MGCKYWSGGDYEELKRFGEGKGNLCGGGERLGEGGEEVGKMEREKRGKKGRSATGESKWEEKYEGKK